MPQHLLLLEMCAVTAPQYQPVTPPMGVHIPCMHSHASVQVHIILAMKSAHPLEHFIIQTSSPAYFANTVLWYNRTDCIQYSNGVCCGRAWVLLLGVCVVVRLLVVGMHLFWPLRAK